MKEKYKCAFILPYPNPYYPSLFAALASHHRIDLTVYFCSKSSLSGEKMQKDFGIQCRDWGIKLLKGYRHRFLRNFWPGSHYIKRFMPFRLLNPGVISEIKKNRFDAIILGGWDTITYWIAAITGKLYKVPLLCMSDANYIIELQKSVWKVCLKRFFLGSILFPIVSAFLCRGTANKRFYLMYGVPEEKLFFFPFSTDTTMFMEAWEKAKYEKDQLKYQIGISPEKIVVLFVGRLTEIKQPFVLLKAYAQVNSGNKALVFVGDGNLRIPLHQYVKKNHIPDVYFMGFQDRKRISQFYALSDIFVFPSSYEHWGLPVHEAMCFGLPVIASDRVGSAVDLVKHNKNGFIFPYRDVGILASYLQELIRDSKKRAEFGKSSLEIVKEWGHDKAVKGLLAALDFIYRGECEG